MTSDDLDWDLLQRAYSEGAAFRAIVDYLAERKRDPRNQVTKLGNLCSDLASRRYQFSSDDVSSALKVFEEARCGVFQRGRPLEKSRLEWKDSAREIAQEVLGHVRLDNRNGGVLCKGSPDSIHKQYHPVLPASESGVPMETFYFPVRPGVRMEFRIRADMTASEINNLADFVRVIAASRTTGVTQG